MKKILVVDDSATVRQQVTVALSAAGYRVSEAQDGLEGAGKIDAERDIAAVICDVNMPHLDGIEMLKRVKADPRNAALPVVMLTTEGRSKLIEQAKAAGAKGWIVKPFKPDLLVGAVRKLVGG